MITENHKDFIEKVKAINPKFKLMGLDIGDKKIGVAFVSSEIWIATPFKTIERKNKAYDFQLLTDFAKQNNINGIVVGIPFEIDGSEGIAARKIRSFCEGLIRIIGLPLTVEDERFTTTIAQDLLKQTEMNRRKRDSIDDQVSAQIILESFVRKINIS